MAYLLSWKSINSHLMSKYVITIDAGTTSERAIIFNQQGQIVNVSQREFEQFYPKPGWVEHSPLEIWEKQKFTINDVLEKEGVSASEIAAIGITNQRETTLVWDRKTGKAIFNAIVWQDRLFTFGLEEHRFLRST